MKLKQSPARSECSKNIYVSVAEKSSQNILEDFADCKKTRGIIIKYAYHNNRFRAGGCLKLNSSVLSLMLGFSLQPDTFTRKFRLSGLTTQH